MIKQLDFNPAATETIEQTAARLSNTIIYLTRDYYSEISCESLGKPNSLVYFGPSDKLEQKGEMSHFKKLAVHDRFNFDK